jgi:hypothetical protein
MKHQVVEIVSEVVKVADQAVGSPAEQCRAQGCSLSDHQEKSLRQVFRQRLDEWQQTAPVKLKFDGIV